MMVSEALPWDLEAFSNQIGYIIPPAYSGSTTVGPVMTLGAVLLGPIALGIVSSMANWFQDG